MGQFGVNVQKGDLASTPEQAKEVASKLSNKGGLILKA
jgi:succinyl-CoA synthetase beta subunit